MPNLFFKQELKWIHRELKTEFINIGIEKGILISVSALGYNSRCYEIILIKSQYRLSSAECNKIIDELRDSEINVFNQNKNRQAKYKISCFGISINGHIKNVNVIQYLNTRFKKWETYKGISYVKESIKLEKNYKVSSGELAYIGFVKSNVEVKNLNDLLCVKLVEEVFNLHNSVLTKIRNSGLCYTTVSKFHEDLNVLFSGIIANYSQSNFNTINNMFNDVEISMVDFMCAKNRLKKEIIFSTTLFQAEYYLLPYQLLKPSIDIPRLFEFIDQIKYEEFIHIISDRTIMCLKI